MTQARNLSRLLNKKLQTYKFTATSGQTTFSDSDDAGLVMSYTPENMLVTYNGVVLENGTEYTATNGTSVVLDTGADSAAEVNVYAFESVSLGGYVPITGGTFGGNVEVTGDLTVDTNTLFVDAENNRVGIGTTSPSTKLHVQSDVYATGKVSLGELYSDPNPMLELSTDNLSSSYIKSLDGTALNVTAGQIFLNHGDFNSVLETYPFGVGVIGSLSADSASISGNLTVDTNTLFVDAENNRVGVGTTTPLARVEINQSSSAGEIGAFIKNSAGSTTGNTASLWFGNWSNSSPADIYNAKISAINMESNNARTDLAFYTYNGSGGSGGIFERMRIDSSGRVTMPYQPAFHAVGASGSLTPSNGQVLPFTTAVTNRGSHYNTSTQRFTAPVSGVYLLTTRATWAGNGTGSVPYIAINGTPVGGAAAYTEIFGYNSVNGYHTTSAVVAPVSMTAGDYADVRVTIYNFSTSAFDLTRSSFGGYLIG